MNRIKQSAKSQSLRRQLPRMLYRWHRRIGAGVCLFVVWLVISGWLLNHSDSLGLPQHELRSVRLANWYGLKPTAPTETFTSRHHWLVAGDGSQLLDGKLVLPATNVPIGMVETPQLMAIASSQQLTLLSTNGDLIDTLKGEALPVTKIARLGIGCEGIVISNVDSNVGSDVRSDVIGNSQTDQVLVTSDGLAWAPCGQAVQWSSAAPLSELQQKQAASWLIPAVSLEKLLLDLHTGRFFGVYGAYVVDAVAGCLLLLAISGFWLFIRQTVKPK